MRYSGVSRAWQTVEVAHLVVAAVERALGGGAVVADDVVDERVVGDAQPGQRVEQPADVVIGVLHEARVDFHLAGAAPA